MVVLSSYPVGTYPFKVNQWNITFIGAVLLSLVLTHIYSIGGYIRDFLYTVKLWTLKTLIISPVLYSFLDLQPPCTVQLIYSGPYIPCLLLIIAFCFTLTKGRLDKKSKSLKILWPWLSAKFLFTFYVFINSSNC